MTPKERLLAVLGRRPVDRPPVVCPGGMMSMAIVEVMREVGSPWPLAHTDAAHMARLARAMNRLAGLESAGVPFCMTVEAEAMGAGVELGDEEHEPRVVAYPLESVAPAALRAIDLDAGRARVCAEAVRLLAAEAPEVPVIGNLVGPVSLATSLVEPTRFYRALRREPDAARALVDACRGEIVRFGEALVAAGADVLCLADPGATGDLIGGALFAELALPALNAVVEAFRVPVIVHICGDLVRVGAPLARLAGAALSVDSCVSLAELRALAPGRPVMGNVSTLRLHRGDPESVRRAAEHCLRGGADILAPACGVSPKTPLGNLRGLAAAALGD